MGAIVFRFKAQTRDVDRAVKQTKTKLQGLQAMGGKGFAALKTGGILAGAAVAGLAIKGAKEIDEANAIIARGTGRTGEDLQELQDKYRGVLEQVNATPEAMANAVASTDTLLAPLGATKDQVADIALRLESLTDVIGGDLADNASKFGRAMVAFGEPVESAGDHLDALTYVSQAYDVSADEMLKVMTKQGPVFRAYGLNIGETALAMGKLSKQGINVRSMASGLAVFSDKVLRAGGSPREALKKLTEQIQATTDKKKQLDLATEAGLTGVARDAFVDAVAAGIDITGDFGKELEGTTGLLMDTAASSETVGEKMGRFMNVLQSRMADVGLVILDLLEPALEIIVGKPGSDDKGLLGAIQPILTLVVDVIKRLQPVLQKLIVALANALVPVLAALEPLLFVLIDLLLELIGPLLEPLVELIAALLVPAFTLLAVVLTPIVDLIGVILVPIIGLLSDWLSLLAGWLQKIAGWLLDKITPAFEGLEPAIQWVSDKFEILIGWIMDAAEWLGQLWDTVSKMSWGDIWDAMVAGFKNALNFFIDLWNKLDLSIDFGFTVPDIFGMPRRGEYIGIKVADLIPDIPRLAEGGIVTDPTLALIGEEGPEKVVPLNDDMTPIQVIVNVAGSVVSQRDLSRDIVSALNYVAQHNPSQLRQFRAAVL